MDLLDRYLAAIGRELPEAQRADITAELRDVLMNRIEEKEAELGRPLENRDIEAVLVEFGHPLVIAGRYRKHQYLIGPEMFPFWWRAIKITLAWVGGVYVVLAVFGVLAGDEASIVADKAQTPLFISLVFSFGIVTLVCALIERYGKGKYLTTWKPRQLPPPHGRRTTTFDLVVETGMGIVALLWWIGVVRFRDFVPDWGLQLELAPVWMTFYWPIVAYFAAEIGSNLLALAQPGRIVTNGVLRVGRYLFGAAILGAIAQDAHYVVVTSERLPEHVLPIIQANFDRGFHIGIVCTVLFMAGYSVFCAWRLWSTLRARRPLGTASAA